MLSQFRGKPATAASRPSDEASSESIPSTRMVRYTLLR